jgi:hypothetical protein
MFHDEADSVRVNAIATLYELCKKHDLALAPEAINALLSVLDDGHQEVRWTVHSCLRFGLHQSHPL